MAIALGRTPSEFRDTATYVDYLDILAYMKKNGGLDLGLRAEGHTALLATIANNAAGGKAKMHDFMPHCDKPDEPTIENFMNLFGAKPDGK